MSDGTLVKIDPYVVRAPAVRGKVREMLIAIHPLTGAKKGTRFYQISLPNGDVLLTQKRPKKAPRRPGGEELDSPVGQ